MSIPFMVCMLVAGAASGTAFRATAGVGAYIAGTSGGTIGTASNAWDVPAVATNTEQTTSCTIAASSASGSRTYGIFFSGFGTGFYSGTLKVYYSLSCTDLTLGLTSNATMDYSLDNGTTWINYWSIQSDLSGVAVTYGPTEDTITLTNINLALLQVRLTCNGSRSGTIDLLDTCSSSGALYDAVFVSSAAGAGYMAAYRMTTSTNVGTAPTNQANAYDTTTVGIDATTNSTIANTSSVATTQTYSGMTNVAGKSGWLIIKFQIVSSGTSVSWIATYDTAGSASPAIYFSLGSGGIGTQANGRSSVTGLVAGTYNYTLYAYVSNINPSNLRVKLSETGSATVTATANVYDVVFLTNA